MASIVGMHSWKRVAYFAGHGIASVMMWVWMHCRLAVCRLVCLANLTPILVIVRSAFIDYSL